MPKKIQEYGKAHIISVPLPAHGDTYTVISHESVIDMSITALVNAGFTIVKEEYRATADGQIAQGIYKLNFNSDPELSMMFAWTNSYNKQVRFKCGVGAYVNKTGTVMVCGDMGSWARKHTGTADTETQETIDEQVANAHMYYNQLCSDKASMELITMNKRKQAQMLGILFAEYQILTTEQASMIRDQMKRPIHVFSNADSLWAFYNYVTTALQHSHPKTWMEDQRILHMFISEVNRFAPTPVISAPPQDLSAPVPGLSAPVDPLYVDPRQTNILDQIAEVEEIQIHVESDEEYAQRVAEIEGEPEEVQLPDNQVVQEEVEIDTVLHQSEEIILDTNDAEEELSDEFVAVAEPEDYVTLEEYTTAIDQVVTYLDPAGNTFEAPVVVPCAAHDVETEKEEARIDISDLEGEYSLDEMPAIIETIQERIDDVKQPEVDFAEEDNFDLDFTDTEEEPGDVPDFF